MGWSRTSAPSLREGYNLREGYKVVRMIVEAFDEKTAKAWLFGTNTRLDDDAPINVLRSATEPAEFAEVRAAATQSGTPPCSPSTDCSTSTCTRSPAVAGSSRRRSLPTSPIAAKRVRCGFPRGLTASRRSPGRALQMGEGGQPGSNMKSIAPHSDDLQS